MRERAEKAVRCAAILAVVAVAIGIVLLMERYSESTQRGVGLCLGIIAVFAARSLWGDDRD